MKEFLLIIVSTILGTLGQISLKYGMKNVDTYGLTLQKLLKVIISSFFQPFVLLGISLYVISMAIWLLVLSRVELSYARPLVGIGFILVVLFSWIFLHEQISVIRTVGVFLIAAGVFCVQVTV